MAKNLTAPTKQNVFDFIETFANTEQKKQDSLTLLEWMQQVSGCEPIMWGPSIIGFGQYHYQYSSGHEGDAPLIGFSPRKTAISLYVFTGLKEHDYLLEELGKFRMGKACIYIQKLSDINQERLINLMKETITFLKERYK